MNKEELGKLYPIEIVKYDPNWPLFFEKEKMLLLNILCDKIALRIEHIGSTAIPNLAAKPTIDILVEIPDQLEIEDMIIKLMVQNGYIHMEEQKDHLMFVRGYSPTGLEPESYHIHMGTKSQASLWDRVKFRNYLRRSPETAKKYENLKYDLAKENKNDREAYTDKKGNFIKEITKLAISESS